MKILHVVPSYFPAVRYGGTIYSVHGLCKALVTQGHEVTVFTTNVNGSENSNVPLAAPVDLDGVKVWYFESSLLRRIYFSPGLGQALERQVKSFDVVHLHSVFLWPTWKAGRVCRKSRVPYVLAPRGMLVKQLIKRKSRWIKLIWIRVLERLTIEQASIIHVTSETEGHELLKFGFNLPKVRYIPNGIDAIEKCSDSDETSSFHVKHPYVLFLSRINWKKGLEELIDAWSFVPDVRLVVAGNDEEGYRAGLEERVELAGLTKRIEFIGPVYGQRKWQLYEQAEIFVLPSQSENFANVVLEAMLMECPVIVTPEVGLANTVSDSRCGLVVEGNAESIAAAVNNLLSDNDLRQDMGRKGRQTVYSKFLWMDVAQEMMLAYQAVLDVHN